MQIQPKVLGHRYFDSLIIYLVLIHVSRFLVSFSAVSSSNWCVQLKEGLGPNALKLFEYYFLVFLCLSAPSHSKIQTAKFEKKILPKDLRFESFLREGALRHRNTRELYSNNLRAFGPKPTFSCTHQFECVTEQKTRKETIHKNQKQGKLITAVS